MNPFLQLEKIPSKEIVPGFHGKFIHTDRMTVGHFTVKAGSVLPEHQHPHEQITNLLAGTFEMTVNGQTTICQAGEVVVIPGNTPHAGRALTDCQLIDVFQPARTDYQ
ncbi:MAG: cupin domain-containing protein [Bacteroidetes bacterium]|nr:MAG: cupin domain-containing protein [Bacteroidota bacterium]PTM13486.1 MAG: cupin domain-containing protein [Bacteroidota bacterium]